MMTRRIARRTAVALIVFVGALSVALTGGRPPTVRAAEPTHAHGFISWKNLYSEVDALTLCGPNTFTQGELGVLRLRMDLIDGTWIDAGSTVEEHGGGYAAPCSDGGGCWRINQTGESAYHGPLIRPADHESWIVLDPNMSTRTAVLNFSPGRQLVAQWWAVVGDCGKDSGRNFTDPSGGATSGGDQATCPKEDGAFGIIDTTGTVIDFSCFIQETGVTENHQATYTWITSVSGKVRLTP